MTPTRAELLYHKKHAVWTLEEISPDPGISVDVDRPTGRSFALDELTTPQIDQFDESRFWRDLTPQFLYMVEEVGPSIIDYNMSQLVPSLAFKFNLRWMRPYTKVKEGGGDVLIPDTTPRTVNDENTNDVNIPDTTVNEGARILKTNAMMGGRRRLLAGSVTVDFEAGAYTRPLLSST